jgi:hypothetical protein
MAYEVNQTELGRILPVTTRQIRNMEADGLPHRADGNQKLYPLPNAVVWWHERELKRALKAAEVSELDVLKARKLEAEAESKEIEVEERRGLLMPVAQHAQICGLVFDRIRTKLQALTASWPPLLVGLDNEREIQAALIPAINEVLEELQTVGDEPPEWEHEAA